MNERIHVHELIISDIHITHIYIYISYKLESIPVFQKKKVSIRRYVMIIFIFKCKPDDLVV